MKKMLFVCLAVLMLSCLMIPALAEKESEGSIIRVGGSATVSLAADTASIQIGVNTRDESVRTAQQENSELMAAVMDAILAAGVAEDDVMTSQFNVYSSYDYSYDMKGNETRTRYYEVQNMVTVTIHDLALIGDVLDAAVEAGANTTYGISFSSTQENEAYQKALTRAVQDAMKKAQVIADAAGVQLGKLVFINASQTSYGVLDTYGMRNTYAYEEKAAGDMGTTIVSGDVSVSADVILEYEFQ